jgi:hypothetical protein
MKSFLLILLLSVTAVWAETPQEVARRVISSESFSAYNPINNTEEELNRASVINSKIRLRHLMLGDSVSDELRVCYALQVLQQHRDLVRDLGVDATTKKLERQMHADELVLAVYLRQMNAAKK